jgi:hypothetical protein
MPGKTGNSFNLFSFVTVLGWDEFSAPHPIRPAGNKFEKKSAAQ